MTNILTPVKIKVKVLSPLINTTIPIPSYATDGSAAMDLCACCDQPILIPARSRGKVPTGIAIEIPSSRMVALVFPRSGLASKHGISLSNAVGVIDSDYRGEIVCLICNESDADYLIQPGDRIAQIGFFPVYKAIWEEVPELESTRRGEGGFGSTGV